jgi:CBS domain-containing protein
MITDRDITIEVVAADKDPASTKARELGGEEVVTIGADDSVSEALSTMASHKVRRLPVIDGHELIGVVSIADLTGAVEDDDVGQLVETISAAP